MILTCPRCATRYLVDEFQVWATGRTVQCDECGERWRAYGQGVRPQPAAREPVGLEAFAAETHAIESSPDATPASLTSAEPERGSEAEADRAPEHEPVQPGEAAPRPAREGSRADQGWMTPAPSSYPSVDPRDAASDAPMIDPPMFRRAAGREPEPSVFAAGGVRLALIVVLVIAAFAGVLVVLRAPLVRFQPALGPVFSAMGMPVRAAGRAPPVAPPPARPIAPQTPAAPPPEPAHATTHPKSTAKTAASKPAGADE